MKYDLEEILKNTLETGRDRVATNGVLKDGSMVEELVAGRFVDDDELVYLSETVYELPSPVGKYKFERFGVADVIMHWAGAEGEYEPEDFLYLDTETTGLSGGTGTWVFMTGLGYFDDEKFVVRQYFMKGLGGENSYLKFLEEELRKRRVLVSFNGKSYDVNLLRTRFIMNGMSVAELDKPNIDLLFLARRLWKNLLDNCRLQTLESEILGIRRETDDDLPSAEIPERYFEYLDTGNGYWMSKVFYHNCQDIVSLPVLLQDISRRFENEGEGVHNVWGIARLLAEQGKNEEAKRCLEQVGVDDRFCRFQLSLMYKREKDYDAALKIWESDNEKSPQVIEELAKYYEHKAKDLEQALIWVDQGLDKLLESDYVDGRVMVKWQERKRRILNKRKRDAERKAAIMR